MASSRRYIRDSRGRFSGGGGGGVVSGPRRPRREKPRGQMTRALRANVEALKQSDRKMSLAMDGKAAGPILSKGRRAPTVKPTSNQGQVRSSGRVSDALRANLRSLAQSDARFYRAMATELKPKQLKGGKAKPKRLGGAS